MKNRIISIIILAAVFLVFVWIMAEKETLPEDRYAVAASEWIMNESSTYKYDGSDLKLKEEKTTIFTDNPAYSYVFSFQSSHGGYGDRSDKIVTQVITFHEIEVIVQNGEIVNAVTDEIFDELNSSFIR